MMSNMQITATSPAGMARATTGSSRRSFMAVAAAGLCLLPMGVMAQDDTLLTLRVTDGTGTASEVTMTRADLEALPQITFKSSTIWTAGVREFSGPSLLSVLQQAGAGAGEIKLTAINDYVVTIPGDEVSDAAPIIATRIDGAPFSVRDKGPLWVVYPYDSAPEFQTETIYAHSIWQLVRIEAPRS